MVGEELTKKYSRHADGVFGWALRQVLSLRYVGRRYEGQKNRLPGGEFVGRDNGGEQVGRECPLN
jgi:hypothetical protein